MILAQSIWPSLSPVLGQAQVAQTVRGTWPGSATHLLATAICLLIVVLVVALGTVLKHEERQRRLRIALGVLGFIAWLGLDGWYLMPAQFDWQVSLPLHICDLGALLAPLVMVWPNRWLRALLYFWALALTTQGFITPTVKVGPTDAGYYWFWLNHMLVVGYAVYDMVVGGYRPTLKDLLIAVGLSAGYLGLILPIDIAFNFNYGFLGPGRPDTTTLIDALGPWPLRLLWLCALAAAAFIVVYLPWPIGRWIRRHSRS